MGRTMQTARKSTGGKAPRKQLAINACRSCRVTGLSPNLTCECGSTCKQCIPEEFEELLTQPLIRFDAHRDMYTFETKSFCRGCYPIGTDALLLLSLF